MTWETIEIAGKICRIAAADSPVCVLIQPTGEHEQAHLTEEAGQILQHASCEALFVSFPIADWDQELSPWHARQAFGEESFGSGAGATLQWILEKLLPALRSQLHLPENIPYIVQLVGSVPDRCFCGSGSLFPLSLDGRLGRICRIVSS